MPALVVVPLPSFVGWLLHEPAKIIPLRFFPCGPNRGCCSLFSGPSTRTNSAVHDGHRDSVLFCNFRIRHSGRCNANNRTVPSLLFFVCPRTVIRRISERIVDSFNRQVFTVSRFFCPLFEREKADPLLADGYAFAAIVLPSNILWVATPRPHVAPARIKAGLFYRRWLSSCNSRLATSASGAFPASEVASANRALFPANASAEPKSHPSRGVSGLVQNCPAPKNGASNINQRWIFCHV